MGFSPSFGLTYRGIGQISRHPYKGFVRVYAKLRPLGALFTGGISH